MEEYLTFDDVTLVPQYSEVKSRSDVNILSGKLKALPFIPSNMNTVSGPSMVKAITELGGIGLLHRYMTLEEIERYYYNYNFGGLWGVSLGVGESEFEKLDFCRKHNIKIICLDIAHGHSSHMLDMCMKVKDLIPDCKLIAGNVATSEGTNALINAGADIIKVGVGGGSLCCTRVNTGHGVPQLSSIMNCADTAQELDAEVIADGGIKTPGDAAKALAAGASYVMLGRGFAACAEAPGERKTVGDKTLKRFMGMASKDAQTGWKSHIYEEGESTWIEVNTDVQSVIRSYSNGLKSALSYSGAFNISEFQQKARFIKISRASYLEGLPHGLGQ